MRPLIPLFFLLIQPAYAQPLDGEKTYLPIWLEGRWEGATKSGDATVLETWTVRDSNRIESDFYLLVDGKTVFRRRAKIEWFAGHWYYIAVPYDNSSELYNMMEAKGSEWVFESACPRSERIGYSLQADGSLQHWMEEETAGRPSRQEFWMKKKSKSRD